MSPLFRSTVALGLLAVVFAPTAAFAHEEYEEYNASGTSARVIQYDPNSSEDIYENPNQEYYSHRGDRNESYYRWEQENRGRHRGWYNRKKKKKHHHSDDDRAYNYNRFGQPIGGIYNRYPNTGNRPQVIYRPGTQNTTGCVNSRFGVVCR